MNVNLFATQIIQTGQGASAPLSSSNLLGGTGVLGGVNADFWNAILGNLAQEVTEGKTGTENSGNQVSRDEIKKETVDLALLQLALLGQDPDVNLDQKLAELRVERLSLKQENRIEQLTKLINHLTNGLPSPTDESLSIEELVARLTRRLENIESQLDMLRSGDFEGNEAPFKLLIATGLDPAQLTRITNRIEEVETKLGRELTVEDLIAGVGNIIPVSKNDDEEDFSATDALALLLVKSDENLETETKKKNSQEISDNIIADITTQPLLDDAAQTGLDFSLANENETQNQINNIDGTEEGNEIFTAALSSNIVSGNKNNGNKDLGDLLNKLAAMKIAPAGTQSNGLQPANPQTMATSSETPITQIPERLSNADFQALFGSNNNLQNSTAKIKIGNMVENATLPTLSQLGQINLPAGWHETFSTQNLLSDTLGFDVQTGMPFSNAIQTAHAATSTPQAGQTHPATQLVSAQIAKAAQNGTTSNITLHLDPPELGRVEVRMEFGDDKSIKAYLVIEKPETYLMLQRDANALERALQNAGFDTNSGSLNYQMAQDNYAFNNGNNGENSNQSSGGGNNGATGNGDEILIETTMTWDVDPETGHVHYSLLA